MILHVKRGNDERPDRFVPQLILPPQKIEEEQIYKIRKSTILLFFHLVYEPDLLQQDVFSLTKQLKFHLFI